MFLPFFLVMFLPFFCDVFAVFWQIFNDIYWPIAILSQVFKYATHSLIDFKGTVYKDSFYLNCANVNLLFSFENGPDFILLRAVLFTLLGFPGRRRRRQGTPPAAAVAAPAAAVAVAARGRPRTARGRPRRRPRTPLLF